MTSTSNQPSPPRQRTGHPGHPGPGVFVPQHVIVTAVCLVLGVLAGVLVWHAPAVWLPIGAGVAVTGLALALCALWHGRHHS